MPVFSLLLFWGDYIIDPLKVVISDVIFFVASWNISFPFRLDFHFKIFNLIGNYFKCPVAFPVNEGLIHSMRSKISFKLYTKIK